MGRTIGDILSNSNNKCTSKKRLVEACHWSVWVCVNAECVSGMLRIVQAAENGP